MYGGGPYLNFSFLQCFFSPQVDGPVILRVRPRQLPSKHFEFIVHYIILPVGTKRNVLLIATLHKLAINKPQWCAALRCVRCAKSTRCTTMSNTLNECHGELYHFSIKRINPSGNYINRTLKLKKLRICPQCIYVCYDFHNKDNNFLTLYHHHHHHHHHHLKQCIIAFPVSRLSSLLRSLAIYLEVSIVTVFLWGRSEAFSILDRSIRFMCCSQFVLYCCRYSAVGVVLSSSVINSFLLWS